MKGRKLLMIPGPIEFEPEVLATLGRAMCDVNWLSAVTPQPYGFVGD